MMERWGIVDILSKPFSPRELVRLIDEILGVGATARVGRAGVDRLARFITAGQASSGTGRAGTWSLMGNAARFLRGGVGTRWKRGSGGEARLHAFEHGRATAASGSQTGTTAGLAGLLVVFPAAHFFLDAAPLDQFAEPADRFLNRLAVSDVQLNHASSF